MGTTTPPTDIVVPRLETDRLVLRGHRPADLDACAALWSHPEVVRYIGGQPLAREDVWTRLLRYVGHWTWLGYGYWAIEEKRTGSFVGEVGLADFKRQIEPPLTGMPEMGWVLSPHAQGRGYATEAVRAVLAWHDQHPRAKRTACIIHPDNQPSRRVAEKCGYRIFRYTTYKSVPTLILTRG
ncbi:MAG TPA: GNAT family N-acetyltransferase [Opitutaceae bacterium]